MQQAIDAVGADQIATNQIELSPFLQNEKVVAFARQHGIAITSYMTLAYGKALQEETIKRIAARQCDAGTGGPGLGAEARLCGDPFLDQA